MVGDLTHRVGLTGRTQPDVVQLLGKPDEQMNDAISAYVLCPSLADIYILELSWKQGRVTSVRVRDT
jgi:hypothetical protein